MSRRKFEMESEQERLIMAEFLTHRLMTLFAGVPINNQRTANILEFIDVVSAAVTRLDIDIVLKSAENRYPLMRAVFETKKLKSAIIVVEAGVSGSSLGNFHVVLCDDKECNSGVMKSGKTLRTLLSDLKANENSFRKNGFKWLNVPYIEQLLPVGKVPAHKTLEDVQCVSREYKRYCNEYLDESSTKKFINYILLMMEGEPKYRNKKDGYVQMERVRFFLNMQHYAGLMRYGLCVLSFKEHRWYCFGYRSTEARVDVFIGKDSNKFIKYRDVYGKEVEFEKEIKDIKPLVEELFIVFGLGNSEHAPIGFIDEPDFKTVIANTNFTDISDIDKSYKKDVQVRWNRMKKNAQKFEDGFDIEVFEKRAKFVKNFMYEIYKSDMDNYLFKLSYKGGNVRMVFSDEDNYKKDGMLQVDANVMDGKHLFNVTLIKGIEDMDLSLMEKKDTFCSIDKDYVKDIVREFVGDFYVYD